MTAETTPAASATTDRALLVDVRRWARYNGWHSGWRGWTSPDGISTTSETGTAVDWDDRSITIYRKQQLWHWDHTTYPVASVRQAVDILCTLGVLPAQLSSGYRTAQVERAEADRDAQQAYADRARLWRVEQAARTLIAADRGDDPIRYARAIDDLTAALDADQPEADDTGPADVEELLDVTRRDLAESTNDDERAEAIAYLLSEWYAAWPDSAITDPHAPLAGELVRLLAPWAAKVQHLQGPLAGYALVTTTANAPTLPVRTVLDEIAAERARQDAKWGEQNHPDGTGPRLRWQLPSGMFAADSVAYAKRTCQWAADEGRTTWMLILREEIAEAFAEDDPGKLRAELVQVAAVAAAWVGAIDRRGGVLPERVGWWLA